MECNFCNNKWESVVEPEKCPFCGVSLIDMDTEESFPGIVAKVVQERGIGILKDSRRLKGLISDEAPTYKRERKLFCMAVEEGIAIAFYDIVTSNESVSYESTINRAIHKLVNDKPANIQKLWYCISNSDTRLSFFSALPGKAMNQPIIIDQYDLMQINKQIGASFMPEHFTKCVVLLDYNQEIPEHFTREIFRTINYPHVRIMLYLANGSNKNQEVDELLAKIDAKKSIQIYEIEGSVIIDNGFNLDALLRESEITERPSKGNPLDFIQDQNLVNTYSDLYKGPVICFDFIRKICSDLEVEPAIYALFDYIDLQYRIVLSFVAISDPDNMWYKNNSRKIGNLLQMAKMIEESGFFSKDCLFPRESILEENDVDLIRGYLPNYKPVTNYGYQDVEYLSRHLRNGVRGHGSFQERDALELYQLIFRLALATTFILSLNEMKIDLMSDQKIIGSYKSKERNLYPFFMLNENGNLLVFNNMRKDGRFEYINYLDGTIILPTYVSRNADL